MIAGLLLAPCDRSAIWLGKTLSIVAFLALAEAVALPAFALFYEPVTWALIAAVALREGRGAWRGEQTCACAG